MKILLLTNKSYHINDFHLIDKNLYNDLLYIDNRESFTIEKIKQFQPDYIFVLHWSHIIKEEVFSNYETVIFHMTDLPFGRGGSPLQNLIVRGLTKSKMSALKCEKGIDSGDIYFKEDISLEGTAQEILQRNSKVIMKMINKILKEKPVPYPQEGEVSTFNRRTPEDGNLKEIESINSIYDYIRMLDGEGYPPAFLEYQNIKYEFTQARMNNGNITARVNISLNRNRDE